jgi:hypothetical protein
VTSKASKSYVQCDGTQSLVVEVIDLDEGYTELMSFEEAREILGVGVGMMNALAVSGALGFQSLGYISRTGLEHYIKYGTQWRDELGKRRLPNSEYGNNEAAGTHPISTVFSIWLHPSKKGYKTGENDNGWVAQYYLRPNRYYFADDRAMGYVGSTGLKLKSKIYRNI